MAVTLVLCAAVAIAVYFFTNTYRNLLRNVALAKSSGLPVVVTPCNVFSTFWLSTFYIWTPILKTIVPASFQGVWIEYASYYHVLSKLV
jgi:hypothetical protein